tara:strand:- start:1246 stop:2103 length:858 start_codon:yes stop_codon:yes gene_type:complete
MGYTKPTTITAEELSLVPLPFYEGDTYTVIRHKFVIDAARSLLKTNGFNINKETYKSNHGSNIAQGIYEIQSTKDDNLGMMFAWTNSYDKSTRFQCGIGAYVFVCGNGMLAGDMASYSRKHTGNADQEAFSHIGSQIKQANKHFDCLIKDRDAIKKIFLSKREQSELAGRLFMDEEIIDASQMSCIKKEMSKPSYTYESDLENAWTFYNHVTHSLKSSHPRTWMSDQKKFHDFMTSELLSQQNLHNFDQTAEDCVDPNQTSILDVGNDFDADIEAQDEVFGEFKI